MNRSGYSEDLDNWDLIRWRGQVASAIRGARGQAFLRDLLAALEALPVKRLIENELIQGGEFCAIGALGAARGVDLAALDPEDSDQVAEAFHVAPQLAREIVHENDNGGFRETPEQRYQRIVRWVAGKILKAGAK